MENLYNVMLHWIRKGKKREAHILLLCKFLPYITAFSYGIILLYSLCYQQHLIIYIFSIPSTIFILVTVLRKIINRSRPYETLSIIPLFQNKKGESFPSRHTASAFAIALAGYVLHPYLGIVLLIVASLIAISRFIAGVHYPSDIFIAILLSILVYATILYLL